MTTSSSREKMKPSCLAILFSLILTLKKNRFLLFQLIQRNIESRYKGSLLGIFWSIAQPLIMLSIYTFVFTYVLKSKFGIQIEEDHKGAFAIIMFCGMSVFNIFSEVLNSCTTVITSNQSFVKKVIFPLEILPISQVLTALIFGIIWFFLLFIGSLFILKTASITMLLLPFVLIPLTLLSCGCGYFVASLGVYIRDMPYIINVILQMLFFMTPIFYPISAIPEKYRIVLYLNPLSEIVEQTRALFLYGEMPNWEHIGALWGISIILFFLGLIWFNKTKKGFADVI